VFRGVPYGKTLRGDPMDEPVIGRNTIVGGMPDQGKSSAARIIMAGCSLDWTAELRIWVPDANYDFETFKRRCSRYVMGADPEDIEQILEDLRDLHAEIQTRGDLLVKHREPEVTRKLASAGVGLHPLICLLEEAHIAIQDKDFGEEISWLLEQITKLGRKRAIHLIVSTQAPTKDSMPRGVTRNCSNGIAFAVGDHVANDALLGQGAYRGGHRATELIPGVDAGTALVKGFSGQRSEMVQAYFLSVRKENDQVTPIIDRSLAEIARRGQGVPGTGQARPAAVRRNLLVDIAAVLDEERVTAADLAGRLRKHAPDWQDYRSMPGTELTEQIRERFEVTGIKVITKSKGVIEIDPAAFRSALLALPPEDLGDGWEVTPGALENPS
jgi:S-DNA-T family DNA segregation ATPase FtsK/SpoIIIE